MYDQLRKPKLLKHVPMIIIRALPVIYYYSKFINSGSQHTAKMIFNEHLDYLRECLKSISENLGKNIFADVISSFESLKDDSKGDRLILCEQAINKLAAVFSEYYAEIKPEISAVKENLIIYFKKKKTPIKVLVADTENDPPQSEKLNSILANFCYYPVDMTSLAATSYASKVVSNDFVVYTSTLPAQIHDAVNELKNFRKPGLALVQASAGTDINPQAVRHGSQLLRIGFQVLFKSMAPIRMFTSIDKIYMQHSLQR